MNKLKTILNLWKNLLELSLETDVNRKKFAFLVKTYTDHYKRLNYQEQGELDWIIGKYEDVDFK